MNLQRFFTLLAAAALAAVLVTGTGVYVAAWQSARSAEQDAARQAAETAARSLRNTLDMLIGSVEGLAADSRYAQILASGNAALLQVTEARLTRAVPSALQVRLLPERSEALDETRPPHMGFADLQMAHEAVEQAPPPAFHGANTPHQHLALARKLEGGGVLLASISPKLLEAVLGASGAALELRQGDLSVSRTGDPALQESPPIGSVDVPGLPWKVVFRAAGVSFFANGWFFAFPLFGIALVAAAFYFLGRWLVSAFHNDQESVGQLVRDLMRGRALGNYPIRISDSEFIVHKIAQLKHEAMEQGFQSAPASDEQAFGQPVAPAAPAPPLPAPEGSAVTNVPASIFRAYDIRGVVGETLTAELVYEIGRAIGSECHAKGEQRVMIARDGRHSSQEFSQALARGLQAAGRTVVDLGLAPTPLLYFATHVLNGKSGVMVTGSHNPPKYNGLKIVIAGDTLAGEQVQKLRQRIESKDFIHGIGKIENRDLMPDYIERVMDDTQLGRPMKIVMDCGNGVAAKLAPALMKTLGCEVVELFSDIDGNFPNHHPDPSKPENLTALIDAVVSEQADLGVAFDGDGDRLGVVDCDGKIIWPDRQMMLYAADVLSRQPGADIIFDVKCTRQLASQIVKNGGRPLMWKTGHSMLKAKMKETGAMLAGEMSGHIFFKERWFGFDDAIYACARLVEILSGDPRSTAEVFAELPDSVNTPELTVDTEDGENFALVEKLKALAEFPEARMTDIDGLRVDFIDGWGLVRPSNTTPSLVLRFEADNEKALARIQGVFRDLLVKVKPDIRLPF
jgi:phosphomannomutase/phosphoglucomutase